MRCINNYFSTNSNGWLEFVHCLCPRPQFIIHGWCTGQDSLERLLAPLDMTLRRECRCFIPSRQMVADKEAAHPLTFHDQCNKCNWSLQSARGCMDHGSHLCLF